MTDYSVWLMETGRNPAFPRSQIFYGEHNTGSMPITNTTARICGVMNVHE